MHERLQARLDAYFGPGHEVPAALRPVLEAIDAEYGRLVDQSSELAAILEALPDSYARISADGVFLEFRRPAERDHAIPVERLRGRHFRDTLPAEAADAWQVAIDQARQTQRTTVFEFVLPTPKGLLSREARFTPFHGGQVIALIRSTTRDKELQARLLLADRMAALGTLAAGVGHEINNPLTFILGNLEWLGTALRERLGDQAEAAEARDVFLAIDALREGAERIAGIARDLRSLARGTDERLGPVDLRPIIESSLRTTSNELRPRARVVCELDEVPPVRGKEGSLAHVLVNLLLNAAHAIEEGAVDQNEVQVKLARDASGRVALSVRDTGCGIPPEIVGRIFDPFFTTREVGGGTGLGLYVCHGIVTSLGGELSVTSEPGRGSTFRVLLPAWTSPGAPSAAEGRAPRTTTRRRVLVVDDEALVRALFKRILGREHEVVEAEDGLSALERLGGGERFDVIFCDLMMPRMSGMALHAALSERDPAQAARMVFITGGAFTPEAQRFVARIPNACLEKPLGTKAIRDLVNALDGDGGR